MAFDVDGLLRLWSDPLPAGPAAEEAFRAFYTDPVTINATTFSIADLVERARAMQATFEDSERAILEHVEHEDKVTVAFRMSGLQVGPLPTSLGALPPTGRRLDIRVIDVLTLTDGLISNIWMVADELGALKSVDAVAFAH